MPVKEKKVFLTFDDGPIPEVTPWVIDCLKSFDAKATFFCVGNNVKKHPEIYSDILKSGMHTGNHTFSHLKAWSNSNKKYLNDIDLCREYINSNLFRPPHGQLYPWQLLSLKKRFDKIVMWDILGLDWRQDLNSDDIYNNIRLNCRPGSIIVLHDSIKAWPRLEGALPRILSYFHNEGYKTELINNPLPSQ